MSNEVKIAITAHRPDKLYGYALSILPYTNLCNIIMDRLIELKATDVMSGMALGGDTVAAIAVLKLKAKGHNIKLHCAIPCLGHSYKWNRENVIRYDKILALADNVILVNNTNYDNSVMQKRNVFMVDWSDSILAIYDGSLKGGTYNCIKYAKKQNKPISVIDPSLLYNKLSIIT